MGTGSDPHRMGRYDFLLTDREREVLRGEPEDIEDISDLSQYHSKIRHRVRRRIQPAEDDLEILSEFDPELAEEIYETICGTYNAQLYELQQRVDRLENELEEERQSAGDTGR